MSWKEWIEMAKISDNGKYSYSIIEIAGEKIMRKQCFRMPKFQFHKKDYFIQLEMGEKTFFFEENSLHEYEIYSAYIECFMDYHINGHSYIRPEMPIKKGDTVVDAGACEGFFTQYALTQGAGKVVLIEPCGKMISGLQKTFEGEISAGRVVLVHCALGREEGEGILYTDDKMMCASSMIMPVNGKAAEENVYVEKLDSLLRKCGVDKVDLVKMDIEGYEKDALEGAKELIRYSQPKLMIATYHSFANAMEVERICHEVNPQYKVRFKGFYSAEHPSRPYLTLAY